MAVLVWLFKALQVNLVLWFNVAAQRRRKWEVLFSWIGLSGLIKKDKLGAPVTWDQVLKCAFDEDKW